MFVHIVGEKDARGRHYKLKICDCPDRLPPRFGLHVLPDSDASRDDTVCMKTHVQNCTRTADCKDLTLDVFLVSRQVYQETVLRPFQQTVFSQMTDGPYRYYGLPAFLVCLVAAQAKAITQMQMVCLGSWFQTKDTIEQLKGLKRLDLLIAPWELDNDDHDFMKTLKEFADQYGIKALARCGLRSARLAVEITVASEADAQISRRVEAGSSSIMQWLHDMEAYLLEAPVTFDDMLKQIRSGEFESSSASLRAKRRKVMGDDVLDKVDQILGGI
jgi:hypothetical protein